MGTTSGGLNSGQYGMNSMGDFLEGLKKIAALGTESSGQGYYSGYWNPQDAASEWSAPSWSNDQSAAEAWYSTTEPTTATSAWSNDQSAVDAYNTTQPTTADTQTTTDAWYSGYRDPNKTAQGTQWTSTTDTKKGQWATTEDSGGWRTA